MKIVLLLATTFFSLSTYAQEFSAGISTEFPIGIGLEGVVTVPSLPVYAKARYGLFLAPYTDAMNSIAESFEFYNSATGDIIEESLNDARFWELLIGWEQNRLDGYFAELSYFSVTGEGQVNANTLAKAIANINLPSGGNTYDIKGEISALIIRGGYKIPVSERSLFSFSIGILKPIAAETQISRDVTGPVQQAILNAANRELDEYMQDTLLKDVYIPTVAVGWTHLF